MGEVKLKEEYSRIVRVSTGYSKGKDRHSKVKTFKGVRDRRVRLSSSTALQLYALQEKLQLSQPSKVVEWLLNAAKHDIHQLPPLSSHPHQSNNLSSHFATTSINPLLHSSFCGSDCMTVRTTSHYPPLFGKECIVEDEHTGGVKHMGITDYRGIPLLHTEHRNGSNQLLSPTLQHHSMYANTSTSSPFLNTRF